MPERAVKLPCFFQRKAKQAGPVKSCQTYLEAQVINPGLCCHLSSPAQAEEAGFSDVPYAQSTGRSGCAAVVALPLWFCFHSLDSQNHM